MIPIPFKNKSNWPYEAGPDKYASTISETSDVPRISIITPSLNQGAYIERTIRSVLLQGYTNLEYIIMDGGSKDETLDIIRHYEGMISYWESGKDGGQSAAINRGMRMATGEILAWINSDDYYLPGALWRVADAASEPAHPNWLSGVCEFHDEGDVHSFDWEPHPVQSLGEALSKGAGVPQSSSFWSRALWEQCGGLDESLHYCMDEDLWMKFYLEGARPTVLKDHLAVRFLQKDSKTASSLPLFAQDFTRILKMRAAQVPSSERALWKRGLVKMAERYGISSWQEVSGGRWGNAYVYFMAGSRTKSIATLKGVIRGIGASVKKQFRRTPPASTG